MNHIVERNTADTHHLFDPRMVHHPDNLVQISAEWNQAINSAFQTNGKYPQTGNLSLRNWLKTKSFETHYECGMILLKTKLWTCSQQKKL